MPRVRFDDIPALEQLVRPEFGPFGPSRRVDQEIIDRFADLTGDHQWIHVDRERAQKSAFGGTIAHGFLLLALLPALTDGGDLEIVGASSVVNYGADRLRFVGAVRAGGEVRARRRLAAVAARGQGTLITTETEVEFCATAKPALVYTGLALYVR